MKPDSYDGDSDSDEGKQNWDRSECYWIFHVGDFYIQNIQSICETVVTLKPELKICLERGFDDQGKTDWLVTLNDKIKNESK